MSINWAIKIPIILSEAIPAFLTIIMMPLAYSITEGIVFGMLSYVILKLIMGKGKEVSPTMYNWQYYLLLDL